MIILKSFFHIKGNFEIKIFWFGICYNFFYFFANDKIQEKRTGRAKSREIKKRLPKLPKVTTWKNRKTGSSQFFQKAHNLITIYLHDFSELDQV